MPQCCDCQRGLPRDAFSKAQFKKATSDRRCKSCAAALTSATESSAMESSHQAHAPSVEWRNDGAPANVQKDSKILTNDPQLNSDGKETVDEVEGKEATLTSSKAVPEIVPAPTHFQPSVVDVIEKDKEEKEQITSKSTGMDLWESVAEQPSELQKEMTQDESQIESNPDETQIEASKGETQETQLLTSSDHQQAKMDKNIEPSVDNDIYQKEEEEESVNEEARKEEEVQVQITSLSTDDDELQQSIAEQFIDTEQESRQGKSEVERKLVNANLTKEDAGCEDTQKSPHLTCVTGHPQPTPAEMDVPATGGNAHDKLIEEVLYEEEVVQVQSKSDDTELSGHVVDHPTATEAGVTRNESQVKGTPEHIPDETETEDTQPLLPSICSDHQQAEHDETDVTSTVIIHDKDDEKILHKDANNEQQATSKSADAGLQEPPTAQFAAVIKQESTRYESRAENMLNDAASSKDQSSNPKRQEPLLSTSSEHRRPQERQHPLSMLKQFSERILSPNSDHSRKEGLETEKKRQMNLLREQLQNVDASLVETLETKQHEQAQLVKQARHGGTSNKDFMESQVESDLEFEERDVVKEKDQNDEQMSLETARSSPLVEPSHPEDEGDKQVSSSADDPLVELRPASATASTIDQQSQPSNPLEVFKQMSERLLGSPPSQQENLETEKKRKSQFLREKLKELDLGDLDLDCQQQEQLKLVQQAMEASASKLSLDDKSDGGDNNIDAPKHNSRRGSFFESVGEWLSGSSHHTRENEAAAAPAKEAAERDAALVVDKDPVSEAKAPEAESSSYETPPRSSEVLKRKLRALVDDSTADELGAKLLAMLLDNEDDKIEPEESVQEYKKEPSTRAKTSYQLESFEPLTVPESKSHEALKRFLVESKTATRRRNGTAPERLPSTPKSVARHARRARVLEHLQHLNQTLDEAKRRKMR